MKRVRKSLMGGLLVLALAAGGCGDGDSTSPAEGSPLGESLSGNATVFAAASLTESFGELEKIFEQRYPQAEVTLNLGSSSSLAAQIVEQGGADVFASADQNNMAKVADAGLLEGEASTFIRNRLQIIVARGNPKGIKSLSDLANPALKVVLAAPPVPVGRYAREALDKAGVTVKPVSEAADVKGVVGPVTLGEADAGIVYASDVKAAAAQAEGIDIPGEHNVTAEYPIGVIKDSPNRDVAEAFVELVLSEEGRRVLTDRGFAAP